VSCDHRETNQQVRVPARPSLASKVTDRLGKFEKEIDDSGPDKPELLEALLRRMRYCLHENHYLITDCKRRLIDIWGHGEKWDYAKLSKSQLEKK
jgi:hypothetical protein